MAERSIAAVLKICEHSRRKNAGKLATPYFVGTPKASQKRISKRISKTIEYLMISVERHFHIWRGIEAVTTRRS